MGCIAITTLCILVNTVLGGDIVQELTDAGANSLVDYVSVAGLAELLSGPGPYTVFAPDNSAFASLAPDTLQALAEDVDLLKKVLSYHVVSGSISSKDISNDVTVDTLEGSAVRTNVYLQSKFYDGFVTVNGKRVKKADIQADCIVVLVVQSILFCCLSRKNLVVDILPKDPQSHLSAFFVGVPTSNENWPNTESKRLGVNLPLGVISTRAFKSQQVNQD